MQKWVADAAITDHVVTLADSRRLSYRRLGRRGGRPVIALHGTPGSRTKYDVAHRTASELGLELWSLDRWGYGASDPHPHPRLAAYAQDVAELADKLALDRFSLIGISGGGPFACAIAAGLTTRIAALALVAPVGEIARPDIGEIRTFHRFCFQALPRMPGGVALVFHFYRLLATISPHAAVHLASGRASDVDRAMVRQPEVAGPLGRSFAIGLARGVVGPVVDLALFARPWQLDLGAITATSRVWLGQEDRNVPLGPARGLVRDIPGCELQDMPGAGHFWITAGYAEVLAWVRSTV